MPKLEAKIVKGVPQCPKCEYTYSRGEQWADYGVDKETGGFFFSFLCPNCTTKRKRVFVCYRTDKDFTLVG